MKIEAKLDATVVYTAIPTTPARLRSFRKHPLQVAAALIGLIFLLGIGNYYLTRKRGPKRDGVRQEAFLQRTALPRQVETLRLEDGTIITLNAGTTLKYPPHFNGKIREVFLEGEAFFKVIHDQEHPFVIHTKDFDVHDLGTEFNVRAYSQDKSAEATLIQGAIEVVLKDDPDSRISLKPLEKIIFYKEKHMLEKSSGDSGTALENSVKARTEAAIHFKVTPVAPRPADSLIEETAWTKNEFVFKSEVFEDLALRLERWYGVNISFEAGDIKQYRFTGTFTNETVEQALSELQMIRPFHFTISNNKVIITR
jgi:ferric-dicitrate binding protein FerR (iron transport regulator)